jgi:hypothetical protein
VSTSARHARHHYGNGAAVIIAAAILGALALLILAAVYLTSGHAAGPETFTPGPQVTAVQPSSAPVVAVVPDRAAEHREHVAHVDYLERLHAAHVRHLDHLAKISSELAGP